MTVLASPVRPFEVMAEGFPPGLCRLLRTGANLGRPDHDGIQTSPLPGALWRRVAGVLPDSMGVLYLWVKAYPPGAKLGTHTDRSISERTAAFVVQLSDTSEYEGGDLIVNGEPVPRTMGNTVLIDGDCPHEVTPVTSGVRWSVVVALLAT